MEEKDYLVTWQIEEQAESPREAAILVGKQYFRNDHSATYFTVTDENGKEVTLDIWEDLGDEVEYKDTIAIRWSVDDVFDVAPNLNVDQAGEVLASVKKNYDASLGVTWETIRITAEILFPGCTD